MRFKTLLQIARTFLLPMHTAAGLAAVCCVTSWHCVPLRVWEDGDMIGYMMLGSTICTLVPVLPNSEEPSASTPREQLDVSARFCATSD